jgi:hypothetical protein
VTFSSAVVTVTVGHLLPVAVSFNSVRQCILLGSLLLMCRTITAVDHRNITVAADLSATASVYRGDLPS